MRFLLLIVLLLAAIITSGCVGENNKTDQTQTTSYFSASEIQKTKVAVKHDFKGFSAGEFKNNQVIQYPNNISNIFIHYPHLKLREGYSIEGYAVYKGLGASIVPFIVKNYSSVNNSNSQFELPAGADDNIMAYISGDDTPRSYLEASLFLRDLQGIGAFWHALIGWPQQVLIENPEKPKVILNSTHAIVIFSTEEWYCGSYTITQYSDVFVRKDYQFNSTTYKIIKTEENMGWGDMLLILFKEMVL